MPVGIYDHKPASMETRQRMSKSQMGHTVSAETRKKIGESRSKSQYSVGNIPWNKGLKTGIVPGSVYKKGHIPWSKGKFNLKIRNIHHHYYKGNEVSYSGLHHWVAYYLGKPDTCEHCGDGGLSGHKIHWANKDHKYRRNLKEWIRLCVNCHVEYDKNNNLT